MAPLSFVRLGFYFFARLLARLGRRDGLALFRTNYADDRLLPLSRDERRAQPSFSGCIACGLCDAHYAAYADASRSDFRGPSDLPLSYSRNLPDYDGLEEYLRSFDKGDLARLERLCPGRVPLRRLAGFVHTHASTLAEAPLIAAAELVRERKLHDPG